MRPHHLRRGAHNIEAARPRAEVILPLAALHVALSNPIRRTPYHGGRIVHPPTLPSKQPRLLLFGRILQ
uniref:Uncharacterized protein n=1 Tax=Arundo donax TaxID=35708 RepID=A0A0A9FG41_ARUDO